MSKPEIKDIRQIIPAEGWFMSFNKDNGERDKQRLACWALCVDENEHTFVTGMLTSPDGTLRSCTFCWSKDYIYESDKK